MLTIKFGKMLTAEEAKKQYCHLTMPCPDDTFSCHADECIAWMWLEEVHAGLVSKEEFYSLQETYNKAKREGRRLGFCCK